MKISVIVPVYNVEKYLSGCLESIANQTFEDYEIVVVNDGSTDGSAQIAEEFASRYPEKINFITRENGGLSAARNSGLKVAKGEYIAFVDSDDTVNPQMLQKMYALAVEFNSDLVMSAFHSVDDKGNEIKKVFEDGLRPCVPYCLKDKKELLLCQNAAWNKLYRKQLIDENGLEFTEGVWYEDLRFTKKYMVCAENIVYCDAILYNYLIREGSIMSSMADKRNLQIADAFTEVIAYYKDKGLYEDFKEEIEFLATQHIFIAGITRLVRSGKRDMLKELRKSFKELFPDFGSNKYLPLLDRNEKIAYILNKYKLYTLEKILFKVRGSI